MQDFCSDSQHTSQTQQLQEQVSEGENKAKGDALSQQNAGIKQETNKAPIPGVVTKQMWKAKPYIKGSRRFVKDGQIYYRTATKYFQPQKHYFHTKQSELLKTWSYGSGRTNSKFLIVSWNINGIRNAFHKPVVMQYLKKTNPDILCLVEVKINQWNYKKRPVKLDGYEGYWNFCKCSAGYSGIAVFSKFQPIIAFEDFQEKEFSQEGRVLTLQFESFYLVVAYVPSAGGNLERLEYKVNQFEKVFYKHCYKLLGKKHVIVAGDLNTSHTSLDYHIPKKYKSQAQSSKTPARTKKEKTSFENFLNMGFVDTFRRLNPTLKKYSWYNIKRLGRQNNLGKRLDYFLVNNRFMPAVLRSDVISDQEGSDHCPIEMDVDMSRIGSCNKQAPQEKKQGEFALQSLTDQQKQPDFVSESQSQSCECSESNRKVDEKNNDISCSF